MTFFWLYLPTYTFKSILMWSAIWWKHGIFFLHPWKPSLCRENMQCCCSRTRHCWIFVKKGLLALDRCCKHSTRSRCWRTGWPKAGRKWSSHKSSSGTLATQLTNPQLLRYNRKSCTGQWLFAWAVLPVKFIQGWKINVHTRGFAGATPPAPQFFLLIYLCKSRFCLERTVKLNLAQRLDLICFWIKWWVTYLF